jgi:hypothetical protein
MNVFQSYLVMQLDTIVIGCAISSAVLAVMYVLTRKATADMNIELETWHRERKDEPFHNVKYLEKETLRAKELCGQRDQSCKRERRFLWLASTLLAAVFVLPSTKTAAVTLIFPQIASSEVIRSEALELYQTAKDVA